MIITQLAVTQATVDSVLSHTMASTRTFECLGGRKMQVRYLPEIYVSELSFGVEIKPKYDVWKADIVLRSLPGRRKQSPVIRLSTWPDVTAPMGDIVFTDTIDGYARYVSIGGYTIGAAKKPLTKFNREMYDVLAANYDGISPEAKDDLFFQLQSTFSQPVLKPMLHEMICDALRRLKNAS